MSTGKRLAKRSIIGTRVCALGNDGLFYSGAIQSVKSISDNENLLNVDNTKYVVRFDPLSVNSSKKFWKREYNASELVGPGFQPLSNFKLLPGQRIFLTYNGREISGHIVHHDAMLDEVTVSITPPAQEGKSEIKKRLEEIRLLESRKSARLMDQDTDFARLADMAADRKRASSSIDVPITATTGSRKRRPSNSNEDLKEDQMNECTAALVLMSLSCSPNSSINGGGTGSWVDQQPVSPSASFSDCCSWRSGTPSPPLSESGASGVWGSVGTDEGIVMDEDYEDHQPRKRKVVSSSMSRILFQCTWPGCMVITTTCDSIENHVRTVHLGPRRAKLVGADGVEEEIDDHEEEFYYTEVELGETYSPPTLSHRDMARPPHEDPEYQKSLGTLPSLIARPINIPKYVKNSVPWSFSANHNTTNTPVKQLKLSLSAPPTTIAKRARGEIKKCRKVYGMEHRDLWCTQCKWKKACSRFSD